MERLVKELNQLAGVKAVRRFSSSIKIELFSHKLGEDAVEIRGDLQLISQKLSNELDAAEQRGEIPGWNWMEKPEKQYQETNLGYDSSVTDRKDGGHNRGYYRVEVEEPSP